MNVTPEQALAFIHAQSVYATVEIEGMKAFNQECLANGYTSGYSEYDFQIVIEKFQLTHNQVLQIFEDAQG